MAGLLPDVLFQVQHTGSPLVRTELLFPIGNQSVSNVSALGLLMAQAMGSMQLTSVMHSFDSDKHVTNSEDVVQVHVWLLSGMCVHMP